VACVSSATQTELPGLIARALSRAGQCLFLTGAGISAESGVPTFRGKEGYWVVGSRDYHPQELATRAAFARMPAAIWGWYLHRLRVCRGALPNPAHHAIAELAPVLAERFLLITQNVDGLHPRAGTPPERTYEVHGNISWMRCSRGCAGLAPVPEVLIEPVGERRLEAELSGAAAAHGRGAPPAELGCPSCAAWMRPHVLWFDEFYDEELFRFESSLRAADSAALLVVVGTTGTTNLPLQIGERAVRRGVPTLIINPEPNPFSELAHGLPECAFLEGTAGHWVPRVAAHIHAALEPGPPAARV
jgi:NAD-dependent deacetylase